MGTDSVTLIVPGLTYALQFSHPSSIPITQITLYAFLINSILADNNNCLQRAHEGAPLSSIGSGGDGSGIT
jgi:hypothetical protein